MKCNRNIQSVILNLIQDLQRRSLSLLNGMRGRCQIKFGMTPLFNNGAFTLIELLVVVLIIGILAAVAVPQYQKAVEKSRATQAYTLLRAIYPAQLAYYLANGSFSRDFKELDVEFPYDDGGKDNSYFEGNGFTWRKCSDGSCLNAFRTYKEGVYGLQIYFVEHEEQGTGAGEIICYADFDGKALEMCNALGYGGTPFASGTPSQLTGKINYYKKL